MVPTREVFPMIQRIAGMTDRLRIGGVSYLNSKPLLEDLATLAPGADVLLDYPSRLADDLTAGRLDVALIPSVEYFRGRGYEIVSDACVAARGPVLSVKLYARKPWGAIRSLALDQGSRTSATPSRRIRPGSSTSRSQAFRARPISWKMVISNAPSPKWPRTTSPVGGAS